MTDSSTVPAPPLARANPLSLFAAGRQAVREVPRLRAFVVMGFLLNYLLFAVLVAVVLGVGYVYVVQPLSQGLEAWGAGEGFWRGLLVGILNAVLWLTQALLLAATVLFGFLVSLSLMSLWYEGLAERIVAHLRPGGEAPAPFRLGAWVGSLGRALKDSLGLLGLSLLAIALGFIPLLGPVLVLLIGSYLMGREVRDPYLTVREGAGDDPRALRRGLTWWTLRTGFLPVLLAMVPVVGWLLLPFAMVYLVAGFAWQSERAARA